MNTADALLVGMTIGIMLSGFVFAGSTVVKALAQLLYRLRRQLP